MKEKIKFVRVPGSVYDSHEAALAASWDGAEYGWWVPPDGDISRARYGWIAFMEGDGGQSAHGECHYCRTGEGSSCDCV